MRRLGLLGSFATIAVAATAVVAPPTSQAIVHGVVIADAPPWMVEIVTRAQSGSGVHLLCSGTVIAPRFVLTAGHCIAPHVELGNAVLPNDPTAVIEWRTPPPAGARPAGSLAVVLASNVAGGRFSSASVLPVVAVHLNPGYRDMLIYDTDRAGVPRQMRCPGTRDRTRKCRSVVDDGAEFDFAVLEMKDPFPASAAPIELASKDVSPGNIVSFGFGRHASGGGSSPSGLDGKLRATMPGDFRDDFVCSHDVKNLTGLPNARPTDAAWFCGIEGPSSTAPGDSGGPAVVTMDGKAVQVGVTSFFSLADASYNHVGDVGAALPWIDATAGINRTPPPSLTGGSTDGHGAYIPPVGTWSGQGFDAVLGQVGGCFAGTRPVIDTLILPAGVAEYWFVLTPSDGSPQSILVDQVPVFTDPTQITWVSTTSFSLTPGGYDVTMYYQLLGSQPLRRAFADPLIHLDIAGC